MNLPILDAQLTAKELAKELLALEFFVLSLDLEANAAPVLIAKQQQIREKWEKGS